MGRPHNVVAPADASYSAMPSQIEQPGMFVAFVTKSPVQGAYVRQLIVDDTVTNASLTL